MRFVTALIAVAAIATPVVAQQTMTRPGSRNPALVAAGSYTADPNHTLVEWSLDHMGFTPFFGLFGDITGTLTLDPRNVSAARVSITVPIAKLTTVNPELTAHLLKAPATEGGKPDFFGPAPGDATFVSTKVVPTGPQKAKVTGNLTFNGVTRPVTLDTEFYGAGTMPPQFGGKQLVGFTAKTTIQRSAWGLAGYVPLVGDEVTLKIAAAFIKD